MSGDFLLVGMKEYYCERTLVWTRGKVDDKSESKFEILKRE